MINAEIITIGDELLIGQVIDTNSAWMAQNLNEIGIDIQFKTTVGDNEADILDAFERASSRASIVLVTGGIGPTKDDITKKTLCKYFDTRLIFDENVLKTIEGVLKNISREINPLTRDQAYVPEKCTVIQNKMGTAPITWFEKNGVILVSMPGVPYEMKWVMTEEILPRLKKQFSHQGFISHQTFWVSHYSESLLAIYLEEFENELSENLKLAYLPNYGLIRLRITGRGESELLLKEQMEEQRTKLLASLGKNIVGEDDFPVEVMLGNLLLEQGLTLSVAESCTGGRISSLITAIPGCSRYFKGSVVSYSNEAKQTILRVDAGDLEKNGAVSEPVVFQMAKGAQSLFQTDCSIATSGIAGPDGGTEEKPVGTVWIAAIYKDKYKVVKYQFSINRENNIIRASNTGMLMLMELIRG